MPTSAELAQAVVVTAEMMGHELSPAAAEGMARELSRYGLEAVGVALTRCRRELSGRLSLVAVLQRLPGQHPGAEEAWALCPFGEDVTVVWTDPMSQAFGVAQRLQWQGDQVGARMAFKETYAAAVAEAPDLPVWRVSPGHDPSGRAAPILAAVEAGRLSAETAEQHLAGLPGGDEAIKRLGGGAEKLGELLLGEGPGS